MQPVTAEAGSYRDYRGRIYRAGERVYRTIMPRAMDDFEFVRGTGLIDELVAEGHLVPELPADKSVLGADGTHASLVIEHPRLACVSWPYEWSFSQLQTAALLHLDIHMRALEHDVSLTDGSAYNIQFDGSRPLFIDSLSFTRYIEGEYWQAHRQFCEQFLNPLLLRAKLGIPHNSWYRGALEGMTAVELNKLLRWRHCLAWQVLTNVVLQARLQARSATSNVALQRAESRRLPKIGLQQMLHGLRRYIAKLTPADRETSVWNDYAEHNSYADDEAAGKHRFIAESVRNWQPDVLWDIGCNTGEYSVTALDSGAGTVIGFDFDHGALERAWARARAGKLRFLPLFLDAANPSPDQGWLQRERPGLAARTQADAMIALALVHHLAIARSIPLQQVVDWLVAMAPAGIIEFVPKSDPMVQALLRLREDHFDDYDAQAFEAALAKRAVVETSVTVSASGRTLYRYRRR